MDRLTIFPAIKTERLILRSFVPEDVEFVFKHFADPDVCRYLYDAEPFTSIEEAEGLIEWYSNPTRLERHRWAIVLKNESIPIGTCGFHLWDNCNNIAELGYDLAKPYWRKGYGYEAVRAALGVAFGNMHLNRVQAFTSVENNASVALLTKLGFTDEGIVRDKHYFRGKYYDHYCFSLLEREWKRLI